MTKEEYIEERCVAHRHYWAKLGLLAAVLVIALLGPLDILAVPEHVHAFFVYRMVTVAILLIFYLANGRTARRTIQRSSVVVGGMACAAMLAAMIYESHGHRSPYFAGFLIISIFLGFIPLSFFINLILQVLIFAIFLVPILLYDTITDPAFFFVASVLILTGAVLQLAVQRLRTKQTHHEFNLEYDRHMAEEVLKQSLSQLKAIFESTADGILVVANDGRITDCNEQFAKMWGIPKSIIDSHDDQKAIDFALGQLRDSVQFFARIRELYATPDATSFDVLELKDGRVFERYSQAQKIDGKPVGRVWSFRDVTEQRVSERALRASEEKFRAIFDGIGSGVAVISREMKILSLNPLMQQWFPHVDSSQQHLCYQSFNTPPRDGVCAYCPTILTLNDGQVHTAETDTPTPEGIRHYQITSTPLRGDDGSVYAAIEMVQDVTERRQAAGQLKQLAQELKTILDTLTVGVSLIKDRRVQWVNAAHARIFGYEPDGSKGQETSSCYADAEEFKRVGTEGYAQLAKGGAYNTEAEMKRRDGSRFWCSLTGRAVNSDDLAAGSIWMLQDITARKEADQAMRESEARFRTLFENAAIAVFIHDENGLLLEANHKALADNGLASVEELRTRDFWLPEPYSLADAIRWLQKAATEGPQHFEWHDCDRQGRLYWRDMTLHKTALGGHDRIVAVALDITDRKFAEAELQGKSRQLEILTQTLEQRVKEEVSLRMKNEQILVQQSKLAAMGETLGAIAHQWRQPLNSLGLIIQNLQDAKAYGELNDALLEQVVGRSMDQIQHMSKTIDDFRNFFRPDKEKTVFETLQAAGEVLALLSAQLQANGISYRLSCHIHQRTFTDFADLVPCPETLAFGYRNEFEHVLLNLVNNARDAILEGRARSGEPTQGLLGFDFYNRDGSVVIEVSDNGGGLDPRISERLFEPYFTTKEQAKGTGLGLYMSKVIIEDHMDGTIAVANGAEGAVFTIALPQFEGGRTI